MVMQDFQVIHDTDDVREVNVFDLPPVERIRCYGLRWLGPVRYKQQMCWRDEKGEKCYVTPEFLKVVCGKEGTKRLQRDDIWHGIPQLKSKTVSEQEKKKQEYLEKRQANGQQQKKKAWG